MKPTDDIQPLVDIAEREYLRLVDEARAALNRLGDFWTRLYGPNEALRGAHEALLSLDATFYEREDGEAV